MAIKYARNSYDEIESLGEMSKVDIPAATVQKDLEDALASKFEWRRIDRAYLNLDRTISNFKDTVGGWKDQYDSLLATVPYSPVFKNAGQVGATQYYHYQVLGSTPTTANVQAYMRMSLTVVPFNHNYLEQKNLPPNLAWASFNLNWYNRFTMGNGNTPSGCITEYFPAIKQWGIPSGITKDSTADDYVITSNFNYANVSPVQLCTLTSMASPYCGFIRIRAGDGLIVIEARGVPEYWDNVITVPCESLVLLNEGYY